MSAPLAARGSAAYLGQAGRAPLTMHPIVMSDRIECVRCPARRRFLSDIQH